MLNTRTPVNSVTLPYIRKRKVYLRDIIDAEELKQMIKEKRIAVQKHPELDIFIYNYTHQAQFKNEWTNAESQCRGLIVEGGYNGEVIARGPAKFFNYGQKGAPELDLSSLTRVTTKHDGSLGIGWYHSGNFGVATRGSFESDQARHATELLTQQIKDRILLDQSGGMTTCFEIIYPENRIVLDYGDRDELIELGQVDNEHGKFRYRPEHMYVTPVITLAEAIRMPIADDEEGFVLDVQPFGGAEHVKLKGDNYKQLHAILTETSGQRIWVQLAARACHQYIEKPVQWSKLGDPKDFERVNLDKDTIADMLEIVPDEFHDWVTEKVASIEKQVEDTLKEIHEEVDSLQGLSGFAAYDKVRFHPAQLEIMRLLKGNDDRSAVFYAWLSAKPTGLDLPFATKEG